MRVSNLKKFIATNSKINIKRNSMRFLPTLALFALAMSTASAGSLFGPPPFTNGSPLSTGVEGSYQASAVGQGITGIIRFAYNSDGNPSALGNNDYIFFINGTIVTGQTDAAIMTNKIYGVLNTPDPILPPPSLSSFDSLGGSFNAKINTKSPFYSFKGNGFLATFEQLTAADPITPVNRTFTVRGMRTSLTP
jgi:hypothetical protein